MLLAAKIVFAPLTKSENFIANSASSVGTVMWKVQLQPSAKSSVSEANVSTASMPVTASDAVPSSSVITTAVLSALVFPDASVELAVNEFVVSCSSEAMNDHAVIPVPSVSVPTVVPLRTIVIVRVPSAGKSAPAVPDIVMVSASIVASLVVMTGVAGSVVSAVAVVSNVLSFDVELFPSASSEVTRKLYVVPDVRPVIVTE